MPHEEVINFNIGLRHKQCKTNRSREYIHFEISILFFNLISLFSQSSLIYLYFFRKGCKYLPCCTIIKTRPFSIFEPEKFFIDLPELSSLLGAFRTRHNERIWYIYYLLLPTSKRDYQLARSLTNKHTTVKRLRHCDSSFHIYFNFEYSHLDVFV